MIGKNQSKRGCFIEEKEMIFIGSILVLAMVLWLGLSFSEKAITELSASQLTAWNMVSTLLVKTVQSRLTIPMSVRLKTEVRI